MANWPERVIGKWSGGTPIYQPWNRLEARFVAQGAQPNVIKMLPGGKG